MLCQCAPLLVTARINPRITPPSPDQLVDEIRAMAVDDGDYSALIAAIESWFPDRRDRAPAAVGNYWCSRHQLSVYHGIVLFGKWIMIPQAAQKNVHKKLHAAHQGIVRTNRRARQTVYWPGITNEIRRFFPSALHARKVCQATSRSL
jgi:hypothetical protein